ncbi:hypothetical protein GOBAR_DD14329 [Gossypium barbadense]|nr:hypothetical protein GOBAR_DD14329 [Gossypium barbadense]
MTPLCSRVFSVSDCNGSLAASIDVTWAVYYRLFYYSSVANYGGELDQLEPGYFVEHLVPSKCLSLAEPVSTKLSPTWLKPPSSFLKCNWRKIRLLVLWM